MGLGWRTGREGGAWGRFSPWVRTLESRRPEAGTAALGPLVEGLGRHRVRTQGVGAVTARGTGSARRRPLPPPAGRTPGLSFSTEARGLCLCVWNSSRTPAAGRSGLTVPPTRPVRAGSRRLLVAPRVSRAGWCVISVYSRRHPCHPRA